MTLFTAVQLAPRDPILGLNEQFAADKHANKVNLGVGVYFDDAGKLPLLACVKAAEQQLNDAAKPRGYLPIDGIVAYDNAVQRLVFGADSPVLKAGRVATIQALGGTGGLKVGADFLKKLNPDATVLITRASTALVAGSRSGPAGSIRPLPRPRSSSTAISKSLASA